MNATQKRMLLTFCATLFGSATQIPNLPPLVGVALGSIAGFFAGWAHMDRPTDEK